MANKFSLWINVKYCRRYVSKQHLTVHKHSLNDKPKILVQKFWNTATYIKFID